MLSEFILYLLEQIKEPYLWGGQHTKLTPLNYKAVSAFYYKMVYASDPELSQVDIHSVSLIDHTGETLMHECCYHAIKEDN